MIIRRYLFQVYNLLVHVPDIMMPDTIPFVTMYKFNTFHPAHDWTIEEQDIAIRALRETKEIRK